MSAPSSSDNADQQLGELQRQTDGVRNAEASTSATTTTNGTSNGGAVRKQVQVVGVPATKRNDVRTSNVEQQQSDDEDADEENDEEADGKGDEDEEEGEGVKDSNLLDSFADDEENIDLTHLRLTYKSIRKMPLRRFSKLQRLCLRQNEIAKFTESDIGILSELRELDMYDNALEKTYGSALKGCTKLESLDYSFNAIRHISNLSHLNSLHTLFLVQNKISHVRPDDLAAPLGLSLRSLELGGNRLRSLDNIGHLINLEELWVGKNKITSLDGIATLTKLRSLSIQSNRITKLQGLDTLLNLEELYLSHNGLEKIEGLDANVKLTTLDIAANKVTEIEGVSHLHALEEFWANNNAITTLNQLEKQLGPASCPRLNTVYLEGNPAQKSEGANYRRKVKLALPQIRQIDASYIR